MKYIKFIIPKDHPIGGINYETRELKYKEIYPAINYIPSLRLRIKKNDKEKKT